MGWIAATALVVSPPRRTRGFAVCSLTVINPSVESSVREEDRLVEPSPHRFLPLPLSSNRIDQIPG